MYQSKHAARVLDNDLSQYRTECVPKLLFPQVCDKIEQGGQSVYRVKMSIWIDPIPEYSGGFLFGKKSKAIKLFTANSSLLAELMKIVRMDDGTYQSVAFGSFRGWRKGKD